MIHMNTPDYSQKKLRHYTIPVFIPELACPHQCVFCNQEKITGKKLYPDPGLIDDIIKTYSSTIDAGNSERELAFFGGNFTGIDTDVQEGFLSAAYKHVQSGFLGSLRVSTRPDYISPEILALLKQYGVKTIELGAQSMFNEVLNKSGRGHKVDDTIRAAEMIKDAGFSLGLQMMTGLPGDTRERSIETARRIIELGAENTRIYPTLVIKDTYLAKLYERGDYTPLTMNEAIERVKTIYLMFEDAGVKVLRTGLHPSEGFLYGDELLAGPFHVSFKELVMTEIWSDIFEKLPEPPKNTKKTSLFVTPAEFNFAVGYNGKNKKNIEKRFGKVRFYPDPQLAGRNYNVVYS